MEKHSVFFLSVGSHYYLEANNSIYRYFYDEGKLLLKDTIEGI